MWNEQKDEWKVELARSDLYGSWSTESKQILLYESDGLAEHLVDSGTWHYGSEIAEETRPFTPTFRFIEDERALAVLSRDEGLPGRRPDWDHRVVRSEDFSTVERDDPVGGGSFISGQNSHSDMTISVLFPEYQLGLGIQQRHLYQAIVEHDQEVVGV